MLQEVVLQKLKKRNLSVRIIPWIHRELLKKAIYYTVCTRLSPLWNKVGDYLVSGKNISADDYLSYSKVVVFCPREPDFRLFVSLYLSQKKSCIFRPGGKCWS